MIRSFITNSNGIIDESPMHVTIGGKSAYVELAGPVSVVIVYKWGPQVSGNTHFNKVAYAMKVADGQTKKIECKEGILFSDGLDLDVDIDIILCS